MEGIVAIIVQAVAGMAGDGLTGQVIKTAGMWILPKLLSGAVGGVAGGSLVGACWVAQPIRAPQRRAVWILGRLSASWPAEPSGAGR